MLSSCALILEVIAIRASFGKKMRPGMRYALWGLVLLRLLIPTQLFTAPWGVSAELPKQMTERNIYILPFESADVSISNQVHGTVAAPQENAGITDPYAGNSFVYRARSGKEKQPLPCAIIIAQRTAVFILCGAPCA